MRRNKKCSHCKGTGKVTSVRSGNIYKCYYCRGTGKRNKSYGQNDI